MLIDYYIIKQKFSVRKIFFLLIYISSYSLNAKTDPRNFDYSRVDSICKEEDFETIAEFASFVNANFKTQHEKFRAVFIWVSTNISYEDSASLDPETIFTSGETMPTGAAYLIKLLCNQCGITCRVVKGIAKSGFNKELASITWNIVTLEEMEYPTDVEYAKNNHEEYFLPLPGILILDHYPENFSDQLLSSPIEKQTFLNAPCFSEKAINYEITLYSPSKYELHIHPSDKIIFNYTMNLLPENAHVDIETSYNDKNPVSKKINISPEENKLTFDIAFENTGTFYITIYLDFVATVYYKVIVD